MLTLKSVNHVNPLIVPSGPLAEDTEGINFYFNRYNQVSLITFEDYYFKIYLF